MVRIEENGINCKVVNQQLPMLSCWCVHVFLPRYDLATSVHDMNTDWIRAIVATFSDDSRAVELNTNCSMTENYIATSIYRRLLYFQYFKKEREINQ